MGDAYQQMKMKSLAWKSMVLQLRGITCCSHLTKHFQTWCVEYSATAGGSSGKHSRSSRAGKTHRARQRNVQRQPWGGECYVFQTAQSFGLQTLKVSDLEFAHANAFRYLSRHQHNLFKCMSVISYGRVILDP